MIRKLTITMIVISLVACSTTKELTKINEAIIKNPSISSEPQGELFLYLPEEEEIQDYFTMINYLQSVEDGKQELEYHVLDRFFKNIYNEETLQSLVFEAYLMQTQNENIRTIVLDYINENNIISDLATAVYRKYSAKRIETIVEDNKVVIYSWNDRYYDENINLFNFDEVYLFNDKLGMLLFDNGWQTYAWEVEDEDEKSFYIIYGGGTNSITISFKELNNIDYEEFQKEMDSSIYVSKYENWKLKELPLEGPLKRANVDNFYVGVGVGPEQILNEIETATIRVYLYNSEFRRGYEVSYFMNFSDININYPNRMRQWNLLLFNALFIFINK